MSLFRKPSRAQRRTLIGQWWLGADWPRPPRRTKRPRFVPAASSRRQPSEVVAFQYKEALARVQLRYGEAPPKEILHKLLDADVDRDIAAGGMPGQAGGETLACYLYRARASRLDSKKSQITTLTAKEKLENQQILRSKVYDTA